MTISTAFFCGALASALCVVCCVFIYVHHMHQQNTRHNGQHRNESPQMATTSFRRMHQENERHNGQQENENPQITTKTSLPFIYRKRYPTHKNFVQVGKFKESPSPLMDGDYIIEVMGRKIWVDLSFEESSEKHVNVKMFKINFHDSDEDIKSLEGYFALETGKISMKIVLQNDMVLELRGRCEGRYAEGRVKWGEQEERFKMRWLEDSSVAFLQNANSDSSTSIPVAEEEVEPQRIYKQQENDECEVCCNAVVDCVIMPCGHSYMCSNCAKRLEETHKCPICRMRIEHIVVVE